MKTRKEVLAEQKYESRANKSDKKKKHGKGGASNGNSGNPNDPKTQIKNQLKEFYAKQGFTPKYEKKGGKQVEIEYSKEHGMQNAMHIIMKHPNLWVV